MTVLPLFALVAQISGATPAVGQEIATGWACASRPVHTDTTWLAANGCTRTPLSALDPQGRELWFVAHFVIDSAADLRRAPLALAIGAVASSDVFLNDQHIGGNGRPSASRIAEQPGAMDAWLYVREDRVRHGSNSLLIHMSGFHNRLRLTRPVHYIVLAGYDTVYRDAVPHYLPAIMMAGALLVACVYFGGAWLFGVRDTQALLVVVMAVSALGQLGAEIWRALWPLPYHWHAWRLLAIEILASGFALALVAYVAARFAPRWRTRALWCTSLIVVLTSPVGGYDQWTLLTLALPITIALLLVLPAARRGVDGAASVAAACALFLVLAAADAPGFLDRGFYLGTAALAILLMRDQGHMAHAAQVRELAAQRRVEQLEAQLLRRRFSPHWLLNTLNALTEWIESDPSTAVRLIEALGEEYHMVVEMSRKQSVPLQDEIALCAKHLEVMSLRVDRAFHLECLDVDGQMPVPPGIVQTLIENAFSHGRYLTGAAFVLRQTSQAGTAQLELTTPAPEDRAPVASRPESGEGLEYVKAQLRQHFGASAHLVDGPTPAGGWRTQLLFGAAS